MHKKYVIMLIALSLVLIGTILTLIFSPGTPETPQNSIAMAPYIEFEGTVVSLSLDNSTNYSEGTELESAPDDSAVIRIDKIISTRGSDFDWSSVGIIEGQELNMYFKYTARPARIITVVGNTTQSNNTVSHTPVPTTITFDNGYFVFRMDGSSCGKTTLPGLQVGSKFRAKVWYTYEFKIESYEIIN